MTVTNTDTEKVKCDACGSEYSKLGLHWAGESCEYPPLSDQQQELVTGMMMGDGSLVRNRKNAYVRMNSVKREFLEQIDAILGQLSTGVRVEKTAEEFANSEAQRADKDFGVNVDNYRTVYMLRTRSHPAFNEYREWYSGDGLRYPDGLALTPTIAKYWYASDGSVNWMRGSPKIQIACRNEMERPEFILDLFREHGFSPKWNRYMVYFSKQESKDILRWMGRAPKGYEYKWEVTDQARYKDLIES